MIELHPQIPKILVYLIFILIIFFIYQYNKKLENNNSYVLKSLLGLRILSFLFLFVILINPIVIKKNKVNTNSKIVYLIDNSISISNSLGKENLVKALDESSEILIKKNIDFDYYLFGDSLKKINSLSEINLEHLGTDFNNFLNNINTFKCNKILLISDGLQNKGMLNLSNFYDKNIYSFGIGNLNEEVENIGLSNIEVVKTTSDSVYFKSKIITSIKNKYNDVKIYLSNSKYNSMIISSLEINPELNSIYHNFSIHKNFLLQNNILHINKIPNETNLSDNYVNVTISDSELKKINILLLSGRLSSNTNYIKKIFNSYNNIKLKHIYKFENLENILSNLSEESIIIFDSFPIKDEHQNLINKYNLLDNNKFIFFQGPTIKNDIEFLNYFIKSYGYTFNFNNNISNDLTFNSNTISISRQILDKIAPINISTSVVSINTPDVETDNKDVLIDINNNLFIFIEDLNTISNKTNKIFKTNNFNFLIDYYLKKLIYGEGSKSVEIYTNHQNYYVNDNINVYLDLYNFAISDFQKIELTILNKDGVIIEVVDEYKVLNDKNIMFKILFDYKNDYFAHAKLYLDTDTYVESSNLIINVIEDNDELRYAYLDKNNLTDISLKSGGEYYDFSLLQEYINTLEGNSSIMLKLRRYNVFNFQFFWFLIILFLIIEWFIRKNKGLL